MRRWRATQVLSLRDLALQSEKSWTLASSLFRRSAPYTQTNGDSVELKNNSIESPFLSKKTMQYALFCPYSCDLDENRHIKIPNVYTLHLICTALGISLSDFFDFDDNVIVLRGKETILIKIYRELSPMSQDTLIKVAKCTKWTSKQKAAIAACTSRFDSGFYYCIIQIF